MDAVVGLFPVQNRSRAEQLRGRAQMNMRFEADHDFVLRLRTAGREISQFSPRLRGTLQVVVRRALVGVRDPQRGQLVERLAEQLEPNG